MIHEKFYISWENVWGSRKESFMNTRWSQAERCRLCPFGPPYFPLTKPLQEKKAQHFVVKPTNHCMNNFEKDWLILFLIGWPFCWTGICSASKFSVVFWIFKSLKRSSDMIWTGKEGGWLVEDDVARNVCERLKVAILLLCDSSDAPMPLWRQVWKRAQKSSDAPMPV